MLTKELTTAQPLQPAFIEPMQAALVRTIGRRADEGRISGAPIDTL
jgi:hypothetical protein